MTTISGLKFVPIFLLVFFTLGIFFVFLIPPFQVMDEQRHYLRAVAVSNGQIFCNNNGQVVERSYLNFISASRVDLIAFDLSQKFNPNYLDDFVESKLPVKVSNPLCNYPVFAYIFPAIGIVFGEYLGGVPAGFYTGRIFNLLFGVLLIFFSLKVVPRMTLWIIGLVLLPTLLLLFSSYSYDVLVLGATLLFVSLYLSSEKRLVFSTIWTMAVLALFVLLLKPVYLLLFVLFLLNSIYRFRAKFKVTHAVKLLLTFSFFVLFVGHYVSPVNNLFKETGLPKYFLEHENLLSTCSEQGAHMLGVVDKLKSFPHALASTVQVYGFGYVYSLFFASGYYGHVAPVESLALLLFVLAATMFLGLKNRFSCIDILLGVFAIFSILFVFLSIYFGYGLLSREGYILGVQGRYFLPILFFASPLFISHPKRYLLVDNRFIFFTVVFLWSLIYAGVFESILLRYYI